MTNSLKKTICYKIWKENFKANSFPPIPFLTIIILAILFSSLAMFALTQISIASFLNFITAAIIIACLAGALYFSYEAYGAYLLTKPMIMHIHNSDFLVYENIENYGPEEKYIMHGINYGFCTRSFYLNDHDFFKYQIDEFCAFMQFVYSDFVDRTCTYTIVFDMQKCFEAYKKIGIVEFFGKDKIEFLFIFKDEKNFSLHTHNCVNEAFKYIEAVYEKFTVDELEKIYTLWKAGNTCVNEAEYHVYKRFKLVKAKNDIALSEEAQKFFINNGDISDG